MKGCRSDEIKACWPGSFLFQMTLPTFFFCVTVLPWSPQRVSLCLISKSLEQYKAGIEEFKSTLCRDLGQVS